MPFRGTSQLQRHPKQSRLAGTGFTDNRQRLMSVSAQTHIMQCPKRFLLFAPIHGEPLAHRYPLHRTIQPNLIIGGNRNLPFFGEGEGRCHFDQTLRIILSWGGQYLIRIPLFDDFAIVHHHNPGGTVRGHSQIMRDHNQGNTTFTHESRQLIQHRFLHCDIKSAGRFIRDDQIRVSHKRLCDKYTLLKTSRQFKWVLTISHMGVVKPDLLEQRKRTPFRLLV